MVLGKYFRAFGVALVRRMTAATAAVTLARLFCGCAMYWEGFTLAMCLVLKYGSEEKGSSLYKCSILLGFILSKNLRGL